MPRFFRIPQHKQFNYQPIYYDEQKERLEDRIKEIEQEYGIKNGDQPVRSIRKGSFSYNYGKRRKTQRYSSTRLIIIMAFLMAIAYLLFFA